MSATYRIKDWDKHFENHESRKVKGVRWVALPNKHDGKSYRRLTQLPDAPGIFAAWTLMLQVASKMPTRGILADEDGALDSDDLSAMTGFPAEIFDKALKALTEPKIGWLEEVPEVSRELPTTPEVAADHPDTSRNLPAVPATTGKSALEGKGREQKKPSALRAVESPLAEPSAHMRLMAELQTRDGPISDGAAQGRAVKWLLEHGYDEATCVDCLDTLKNEDWRKSRVSWLTVKTEIGAWSSKRKAKPKERSVVI